MSGIEIFAEAGLRIRVTKSTAHRKGRKHGIPTTLIQSYDPVSDLENVSRTEWVSVSMADNELLLSTIRAIGAGAENDNTLIIQPENHKWSFAALGKAIGDYVERHYDLPHGIRNGVGLQTLRSILLAASGSEAPRLLSQDEPVQRGEFSVTNDSFVALSALLSIRPETSVEACQAFADHFDQERMLTTRNATAFAWKADGAGVFYELCRMPDGPNAFKECMAVWKLSDFETGDLVTRERTKEVISLKEQDRTKELSKLMSDMRDCLSEIKTDTTGDAAVTGRMTLFAFPPSEVEGTWACLAARPPSLAQPAVV